MQVREDDLKVLQDIFSRFPTIQRVLLFGSRATGTARRTSDIDLAIIAPDMSPAEWADLCEQIEESPIIYQIDMVRFDTLPQELLKERIIQEGVVIYPSCQG
ncbi:MAG: nucleotidyltransferase domain-containing protein [Firmicutes bacterium]|nr:nucleotidyltransferase domain-containing protein [Bacillota bacterium]